MARPRSTVPVEERLFSVVLALLATEHGLTKSEVLQSVQGYRQRYRPGGDNSSLERQFERDKDDLRDLGIPLESFENPAESGDNHLTRYRIPKGDYDIPSDVRFTPEETTLLALAAAVWRHGSLSVQSERALTKLRGAGAEPVEPLLGLAPKVQVREAAFEPLSRALERHVVVSFSYMKPSDALPRRRVVEPRALVQHQGRWHLSGWDRTAQAMRTFLLRRIVGSVTLTAEAFTPPAGDPAREVLAGLDRIWQAQTARLRVSPGSEAALRLARRLDPQPPPEGTEAPTLLLHYTDEAVFADELAGYGPEVVVQTPQSLRDAVLDRLRRVATAHAGTPRPGGHPRADASDGADGAAAGALMEGAGLRDRADGAAAPGGGSRHPGTVRQTPAPRAPDRLVLLLALVPYLLEQGTVGVDEAARHFGVPAERIRRAVRLIAVSGVPGQSRQYLPGDLFDISWDDLEEHDRITLTHRVAIDEAPRFSAREAAALIAGLQYLQSWAGPAGGRVPATLMAKLARSSAGRPSAVAVEPTADASRIAAIRIALDDAVQVEFDYTSVQGESTHRIVDPLRLDSVDQDWYLRAWCHTRQAVRTFRLDRMTGFDVTERPVALQPGQASIPEGLFDGATTDFVIDLAVDTACLPIIGDYLEGDTAGLDAPGRAVVGIRAAHVHGVKRLVCTLGGRAEVLAPESARQAVARWAVDAIAGYASDRVAGRAAS